MASIGSIAIDYTGSVTGSVTGGNTEWRVVNAPVYNSCLSQIVCHEKPSLLPDALAIAEMRAFGISHAPSIVFGNDRPVYAISAGGQTGSNHVIHSNYVIHNTATNATNITQYIYGANTAHTTVTPGYNNFITHGTGDSLYYTCDVKQPTPLEQIKSIIKSRMSPAIHRRNKYLTTPQQQNEMRARETLRRVIGEEQFRGFLIKGFISVKGKSGRVYQIFPGHNMTTVYDKGKPIEKLCVVMSGDFPPTDSVIMRYLLILNDEAKFRSLANVSAIPKSLWGDLSFALPTVKKTLPDIMKELRSMAA